MQFIYKSLLKFCLKILLAILYIEEFKDIGVFNDVFRLSPRFKLLYFRPDQLFGPACKEALIIKRIDLSLKLTGRPVFGDAFVDVKLPCKFWFYTHQQSVMCPTQLATQCVANWKSQIKLAHVFDI